MADEELILRVEADTAGAKKSIDSLTTSIEETTAKTKELQAQQKTLGARNKDNAKEWDANAKAIALNKSEVQKLNQQRRNSINVAKNETRTLSQLRSELNLLKQQRNENTVVGSKAFDVQTQNIAALNTEIKAAEEAGGDFQRSVGNYSTALDGLGGTVNALIPGFSGMIQGIQGMTKAALKFILTPLGATLAAIVIGLKAVQLFFTRTEEGSEKLRLATALLSGVWEAFLDVMSAVGKLIVDEVVAGFEQAGLSFDILVLSIRKGLLELELRFAKLTRNTSEINRVTFELIKTTKNLAFAQGKMTISVLESSKAFTENKEAIEEAGDAAGEKIKKTVELKDAEIALEKVIVTATVRNAELNRQISEGIFIAEDQTKSFEERRAALQSSGEAEQELADSRLSIAKEEARIAKERNAINNSLVADNQEVADAIAKVSRLEQASLDTKRTIQKKEKTLLSEEKTARQKNADDIEAKAKDARDIVNKKIELDNKALQILKQREIDTAQTIEERVDRELELEDLKNEQLLRAANLTDEQKIIIALNHENAIAAITQKGADQVAAITLKETNKKKALDIKDKADRESRDAQSQQNLIATTTQALNELSDLTKENVLLSKSFAIAAATINTLQAITKTLAVGGALATPAAIGVGALGFAQVAKIASTSIDAPTTTPGGSGISGIAKPINVDTGIIDRNISDRQILESALEGITAQISITELNRVQNKVSVAERDSKLV